ncbi:MAG: DUF3244 domain-containing protein [Tannerella sp.]|jgi:hypothetical protein|nr:DUF3244 domain-containing protein [Tannerella sp.]
MKLIKKTLIILLVCIFNLSAFARQIKIEKQKYKKRSISFIPIMADIDDNNRTLNLLFMEKMGDIWVEISNENDHVVFAGMVETDLSAGVVISLPDSTECGYQLFIMMPNGTEYSSKFELY